MSVVCGNDGNLFRGNSYETHVHVSMDDKFCFAEVLIEEWDGLRLAFALVIGDVHKLERICKPGVAPQVLRILLHVRQVSSIIQDRARNEIFCGSGDFRSVRIN